MEPSWLLWARELQAIAQTGLEFAEDPYDRERYIAVRAVAARMMAQSANADALWVEKLFAGQTGYATPKVDVHGAVFREDGRILMVRELADSGRWSLPGGWAEVNQSASEAVVREVLEESGFDVSVRWPPCTIARVTRICRRDRSTSTSCFSSVMSSGATHKRARKPARSRFLPRMRFRATCRSGASCRIRLPACLSTRNRARCPPISTEPVTSHREVWELGSRVCRYLKGVSCLSLPIVSPASNRRRPWR
jgi:ADP-ribose pyrophosphatase YjhB (NUDIX family)